MTEIYRVARLIDGVRERSMEDAAVVIEGEHITAVGPARDISGGAEVRDLGNVTLLPGLIDAHVHLVWSASREPHDVVDRESRYLTVLRCAANAARHIRAGVTTIRDLGSTDGMAVDVARAIEAGVVDGPRVVAAGRAIAMTGGHSWFLGCEADGADAVRHAVRSELKAGASCIKLMASGGVYGHAEEVGAPQLTVEEMQAGVDEAHKAGVKVAAHAYSPRAINNALDAGVDSIEHGSFLDVETAERMQRQNVYLVPTLSVYQAMYDTGPELDTPDYIRGKTGEVMLASRDALLLAATADVPLATGTDCGAPGHPHGTLAEEARLMVEAGLSTDRAIQAATSAAADLLGLADEIGTIEPGKRADLLVVAGDPLSDIRALREVRHVFRNGRLLSTHGMTKCGDT